MNRYRLFLFMLLVFLFPTWVRAQKQTQDEGPVGIFETRQQYDEFMGSAKTAAAGNPDLQAMIPMLNDIALEKPVGWTANRYGISSSTLGVLSNSKVRNEIEMVDGQYDDLKNLSSEIQRRAAKQLRELDFSDRDQLVKQIRSISEAAREEMNAVLLPHQLTRLKQIRMQSRLRHQSLVDLLTSNPIKADLEISDDQAESLRKAEKEIEAELQREIAKLREKARDRLLSKLSRDQKAEVEAMFGEAFDFGEEPKRNRKKSPKKGERTQKKSR